MKSFIEEYGLSILATVIIMILIGMCTPFGNATKQMIENSIGLYRKEEDVHYIYFYAGEGTFSDGTNIMTVEAVPGDPIGQLPVVTSRKYEFGGWYTSPSGGKLVTSETQIQSEARYYALWNVDEEYKEEIPEDGYYNGKLYSDGIAVANFDVGTKFYWHDLTWKVLKITKNTALIISDKVLDKNFKEADFIDGVPWNSNTAYTKINEIDVLDYYADSYLNEVMEKFYTNSLAMNRDGSILATTITIGSLNDENGYTSTEVETRHVFSLSRSEVKEFLDSKEERAGLNGSVGKMWWTRTGRGPYCNAPLQEDNSYACETDDNGNVIYQADQAVAVLDNGDFINVSVNEKIGIRPAMYIDLAKLKNISLIEE